MQSPSTYFSVAVFQEAAINPLQTVSTGFKSAKYSGSANIVLMTPLPAPISSPVGPFKLSTQPGNGSSHAGITVEQIFVKIRSHRTLRTTLSNWSFNNLSKVLLWLLVAVERSPMLLFRPIVSCTCRCSGEV